MENIVVTDPLHCRTNWHMRILAESIHLPVGAGLVSWTKGVS